MIQLTQNALLAAQKTNVETQLVFEIDGYDTKFTSAIAREYIRIGDEGLQIDNYNGEPWKIGGTRPIANQSSYISFGGAGGTTTRITQQLNIDKGQGTSVVQMNVALIDKNEEISRLISPGLELDEILGRECRVYIGFKDTAFPSDYITIFRGIVEDIQSGPGLVKFALSSPDQKKRQTLFTRFTGLLTSGIAASGSVATISVDSTTGFLTPITGPDGTQDSSITFFARIGDEFFKYTGKTSTTLTGCTRNASPFSTGEEEHEIDDEVNSVVRINGNALDIARKLMLSGWNGPFVTLNIGSMKQLPNGDIVDAAIHFMGVDLSEIHGITVGDWVTFANTGTDLDGESRQVASVVATESGSYITITEDTPGEVGLVLDADGTAAFRSQWDVYPVGCKMKPSDVDLAEFERLYTLFLSSFDLDFRLQDSIMVKDFVEQQILRPLSCYSIPRKGRVSIGYHIAPLPSGTIPILNQTNIKSPAKLTLRRSLSKNFYNAVVYYLDRDDLDSEYKRTVERTRSDLLTQDNVGFRQISVSAEGMRTSTSGPARAQSAADRMLNRYSRGAQFLDNIQVMFDVGLAIEVGDIVLLDLSDLKVTDTDTGNRRGNARLVEVVNKSIDFKSGEVSISVVDTNFSTASRYGLISPASKVKTGVSQTQFIIEPSYSEAFGENEYLKWQRFGQCPIRVRSEDGTTRIATTNIESIAGNKITVSPSLGFTPQPGDIMEFPTYPECNAQQRTIYAFMRDTDFDDGSKQFQMI